MMQSARKLPGLMSAQKKNLSVIGSSNSRRIFGGHLTQLSVLSGRTATLKGATTFSTGKKACEELKGDDMAIISFITNTLVDECGNAQAEELDSKITEVLSKYVEIIKSIPATVTIIIMFPFPRVEPAWVFESIDYIQTKLTLLLDSLGPNIHRFPYFHVKREDYETDFIHLKQSVCDNQFKDFCTYFAATFDCNSEVELLEDFSVDQPMSDSVPSVTARVPPLSDSLLLAPTSSPTNAISASNNSADQEFSSTDAVLRPRVNHWGTADSRAQQTVDEHRYPPRGQIPDRWASSQKRPADGPLTRDRDSNRQRLSQFAARTQNDDRQSNDRQSSQWNPRSSGSGRGWGNDSNSGGYNNNGFNGRRGDSNPGQSVAGWNSTSSGFNGQSRGGGSGGRGRASGASGVWGTNQSSQPIPASNGTLENRIGKLECEMRTSQKEMINNYELTETALNKTNAASVIIDGLPFGTYNSNQPAVKVVGELIETMGGPVATVRLAFFLAGGVPPSHGTFARIKAIFDSAESAFEFRSRATAARRRREDPWTMAYVSNDPTKGTRVRIEILQQLAKAAQTTVEGRGSDIIISKFEVRPMMIFKKSGKAYRRLPYTEALQRFGRLVDPRDFELARKIGGREYEGRMEAVFGI